MQFELRQILLNSDDQYSIPGRDSIHRLQKVQNLLNEKLTPLRTKPPGLDLELCLLRYNCGLIFQLDLVLPTDGSFTENIKEKKKKKKKRKKERNRSQSQCLILIMLIQIYGLFSPKHDWLSLVSKTMQGYSEFCLFIG